MELRKKNLLCLAGIVLLCVIAFCAIFTAVGAQSLSAEGIEAKTQGAETFAAGERNIEVRFGAGWKDLYCLGL